MKYMGSKARFTKEILPIILDGRREGQYYVEPFAGGMNSICSVDGNRIANDLHYYLIEMWKELLNGWEPIKVSKEEYIKVRERPKDFPSHYVGWVGFNCSYSGKWFGGYAGETQTKNGSIRDYQDEAIRNTVKQVLQMQGTALFNTSYQNLRIPENSIIYCDPPYLGTTGYLNSLDYTEFWQWVRDKSAEGHSVFISEYQAPDDFECVWYKEAKSSLSANGKSGSNKLSIERLFKHKH